MAVDLEEALITWLRTKDAVVANLDKDANNVPHIYSDYPQTAKRERVLVLHEISGSHAEHLTGTSTLAWKRFQFDCHGPTPKKARQLRDAVKDAIETLQNRAVIGTGVRICGVEHGGDYKTDTAPADGSAQQRYTRSTDYQFSFQNS